ncbi:hypothetical protein a10_05412 [Streptomyces acidiscabies]|nr:hypothetical protein a10_05412 [Streptomyces acidiscabies]
MNNTASSQTLARNYPPSGLSAVGTLGFKSGVIDEMRRE